MEIIINNQEVLFMKKKILITPRSLTRKGHPALNKLTEAGYEIVFCPPGQQPTEDQLLKILPDCIGYLAGVERISTKVLESAKHLKVISRNGVGVDNLNIQKAEESGITVCRALGANSRGVAELTWGYILAAVRSIPNSNTAMKNAKWERIKGIELENKVLGLIGCGKIGKYVAEFAIGFNMFVLAYDPYPDSKFKPGKGFSYVAMDKVLTQSDIISLHCPLPPDRKPLINEKTIKKMKKGVYLINTARGELIDDNAVWLALKNGHFNGLAMDAFQTEPPENIKLIQHPKVIATPHIGGYTEESVNRATVSAVNNLLDTLKKHE